MSEQVRRPFDRVYAVALALKRRFAPVCTRIEMVGCLRRKCPTVGDIAFILIPRRDGDLFGNRVGRSRVDVLLEGWGEFITILTDGDKHKRFTFYTVGGVLYTVSLFIQSDAKTWGVNMMRRTGPPEFSKNMLMRRWYGGLMPNDLSWMHSRVFRHGVMLETPEEGDVFKLWGMRYIKPEDRE